MKIKLTNGNTIPVESHQVRIVRNVTLNPVKERLGAIRGAGFNTFCLKSRDVFVDMLTDSGTNAMSDRQLSAMMIADDAYAGSESMERLEAAINDILGFKNILPVHQGRAAEHLISRTMIKPGQVVIMNYHFTTSKVHVLFAGGVVEELCLDEALKTESSHPFKGNMDIAKLNASIRKHGKEKIAFIRMEATTNLLGGQPFSMQNLREVSKIAKENGLPLVLDGSLIAENAFFIKEREAGFKSKSVKEIILEMMSLIDLFYFSGRKSSSSRGGVIATNNEKLFNMMKPLLPVFEGFFTYGGMSSKEMEAMAVGIREMAEPNVVENVVAFVQFFVEECIKEKIPVVTPPGGLACHVDAKRFLSHIPQSEYPAGSLAAALFLISGVRGMERGTISMERNPDGSEALADIELLRLAVPRRVFTISHVLFTVDRLKWLLANKHLVGGLKFTEEPPVLRFFVGKLAPIGGWDERLVNAFEKDFGKDAC
ncbi:MAG: tryptophanase [Nanoarchaeota archaeon]|nr:tryptophanase [Nanoarchaeota archaeon]